MRFNLKLFALSSFLVGFLFSCDKGTRELDVVRPPETTSTEEIDFTVESDFQMDEEQARLIYEISTSVGNVQGFGEHGNLFVRFAVRRGDNGIPVVQESNSLLIKGQARNKSLNYSFKGKLVIPSGTGPLQIAALLMGEDGGDTYLKETSKGVFETVEGAATPATFPDRSRMVNIKIPYIAKWSPLQFDSSTATYKTALKFKPSGTLLRMRVLNETDAPVTVSRMNLVTDAYVSQWRYSFNKLTGNDLMEGHSISTARKYNWYDLNTTIKAATTSGTGVNARIVTSGSPWQFIWVMPKSSTEPLQTTVDLYDNTNKKIPVFASTSKPALGSVALTLRLRKPGIAAESCFPGGKIPLMYMADYNLIRPKVFATTHSTAEANNYYIGANTVSATSTYVPAGYHLPTREEWLSVIPGNSDGTGYAPSHEAVMQNSEQYRRDVKETISVAGQTIVGYSDYNYMSTNGGYAGLSTYGLRFKGELVNGKRSNCNLVAYRYRYLSNGGFVNGQYKFFDKYLEITCRYLGNAFRGDINTISNDEFWNINNQNDVVRKLPLAGQSEALIKANYPERGHVGSGQQDQQFFYWTSTPGQYSYEPYRPTGGYWYAAGWDIARKVLVISEYHGGEQFCAVRLWKNN